MQTQWGITPEQVVDFQALVGDSVDNVPGVPLVGPKFARQLLEQYGTLESVLDHAGDVPGAKRKENLIKFRDQALLSRELVRLDAHVPVAIDWNAGRAGRIDLDAALALFHDFGFRSIGQKLAALVRNRDERGGAGGGGHTNLPAPFGRVAGSEASPGQCTDALTLSLSQRERGPDPIPYLQLPHPPPATATHHPPPATHHLPPFTAHLVDTPEAFEAFLAQLRQQKSISLDTETTSVWPRWAKLVGMSFAWNDREAWYLPLRAPAGEPASRRCRHPGRA